MILPRVRRALRAAFTHLETTGQLVGMTPLSFDIGGQALTVDGYVPETAYFAVAADFPSPNRAPGVVKPNWKWSKSLFYMRQQKSRYGYILTDAEFVAIRLELSTPRFWDTCGTVAKPRLTLLTAMWYLGMLAAQDEGEDQWLMP